MSSDTRRDFLRQFLLERLTQIRSALVGEGYVDGTAERIIAFRLGDVSLEPKTDGARPMFYNGAQTGLILAEFRGQSDDDKERELGRIEELIEEVVHDWVSGAALEARRYIIRITGFEILHLIPADVPGEPFNIKLVVPFLIKFTQEWKRLPRPS